MNLLNSETIPQPPKPDTSTPNKEIEPHLEYYLDNPDIRQTIFENWPDITSEMLDRITRPTISAHPDELETWEVNQRKKRVAELSQSSNGDPLLELQMNLYEECFGVNASPGRNQSFKASYAPSPGGLLSHGYYLGATNGYTLEAVSQLPFTGTDAKTAVRSLEDHFEQSALALSLAQICYPIKIGSGTFTQENFRRNIKRILLEPKIQPSEEVNTWAFRLVHLLKICPELSQPVQDQQLKSLADISKGRGYSLGGFWSMLWGKMSKSLLSITESGSATYAPKSDENVLLALGELLKVRLHPETQILFKYHSPSGFLNEEKQNLQVQ